MKTLSPIRRRRLLRRQRRSRPALRFTPSAWAKLLYLRDVGPTEVGGFGISREGDPLLVEEIRLVAQEANVIHVQFDDEAVADYFDEQVDQGLAPERFSRIWLHTHPGECALPSATDEETFARVFGTVDWAVMGILARGGQTYARLKFNAGPGGELRIPVRVDWSAEFMSADHAAWEQEYLRCVRVRDGHDYDGLERLLAAAELDHSSLCNIEEVEIV